MNIWCLFSSKCEAIPIILSHTSTVRNNRRSLRTDRYYQKSVLWAVFPNCPKENKRKLKFLDILNSIIWKLTVASVISNSKADTRIYSNRVSLYFTTWSFNNPQFFIYMASGTAIFHCTEDVNISCFVPLFLVLSASYFYIRRLSIKRQTLCVLTEFRWRESVPLKPDIKFYVFTVHQSFHLMIKIRVHKAVPYLRFQSPTPNFDDLNEIQNKIMRDLMCYYYYYYYCYYYLF
jgi:hypothetical protein